MARPKSARTQLREKLDAGVPLVRAIGEIPGLQEEDVTAVLAQRAKARKEQLPGHKKKRRRAEATIEHGSAMKHRVPTILQRLKSSR